MRSWRLLLGATIVLAGALRFTTLGAKSYWSDEGLTIADIRGSFGHMLHQVATFESSPPLYFATQWGWSRTFGLGEVGTRSLSALLGTLTVLVVFFAARRLLGDRTALIAAALAAVNPLLIWYSQEARSYALLIFLGALSLLFFIRGQQDGRMTSLALWAGACILMLYTHYLALPLVAAEGAWLVARRTTRMRSVGALAVVGVCCLPLVLTHSTQEAVNWIGKLSLLARIIVTPISLVSGFDGPVWVQFMPLAVAFTAMSLWLLLRRGDTHERRGALVVASLGASVMIFPLLTRLLGNDLLLYRYVVLATIPAIIVMAAGLGARRAGRLGAATATGLVAMSLLIYGFSAWTPKYGTERWRDVAASLRTPADDKLVMLFPTGSQPLAAFAVAAYLQPVRIVSLGRDRGALETDRRRRIRTREVDVLSVTQRAAGLSDVPAPRAPARASALVRGGFALVSTERHRTYALARYRATGERLVPPAALEPGAILGGRRMLLTYAPR